MAQPNISAALTAAQKTTMKANVNANMAIIAPFGVNLTPDERKKRRKAGPSSVGYVQGALKLAQEHPEIIPPDFSIPEMAKDVTLFGDIEELQSHHNAYIETLNDTKLALSNEMIKQADRVYALAKEAASRGNTAITANVAELARQFEGQRRKSAAPVFTLPAGGTITLDRIALSTAFNNLGTTDISITNPTGRPVLLVPAGTAITIEQTFIPVIVVHNESATQQGSFSVRQQ